MTTAATEFLLRHGYAVLFGFVLAEQIGFPLPAAPLLLAAGALAGLDRLSLAPVIGISVIAALIGDMVWFYLGKSRGSAILGFLCRISLEPDSCVSKTRQFYARYGPKSLLISKFIPGLSTVAPPMAGMFKLSPWKFVALDGGGTLLWVSAFTSLGWIFHEQLEDMALVLERLGSWLGLAIVLSAALYILYKYVQRRKLYRALKIPRVSAAELKERMAAGGDLRLIDLRNELERREGTIPGAVPLTMDRLDSLMDAKGEIILYCACPGDRSSALAAMRLHRLGVTQAYPLEGGFPTWRELGFPIENSPGAVASNGVRIFP